VLVLLVPVLVLPVLLVLVLVSVLCALSPTSQACRYLQHD
jgi:hypothetical protein